MPTVRRVERRQSDKAMHALLCAEDAVRILALDEQRNRLDPRLFSGRGLEQPRRETAPLGPAQVHAQNHLGPVHRIGTTRARAHRHHGRPRVVLAREECTLLQFVNPRTQAGDGGRDLVEQFWRVREHHHEIARVGDVSGQALVELHLARIARALRRNLDGPFLVVPEAGLADQCVELVDPLLQASRVKGNHEPTQGGL